jgi:chromate transporter
VALLFLKLGIIGFGGPAAHVALMREEIVHRRKWVTETRFLDLFGVASLIPGPSSTELAIFLGYERAGLPGLVVGGALFVLPAMLIVLALAWGYVRFGTLPATDWLLYGVEPAVVAIVAVAIWGLARTALTRPSTMAAAAVAAVGGLLSYSPLLMLAAGGAVTFVEWAAISGRSHNSPPPPTAALLTLAPVAKIASVAVSGGSIFLTFLKIGAVAFGGGYVLLAFLNADIVHGNHWLSDQQVLDAVAVGQVTPGPVFTTATFLGYLLGGVPGALLATLGIFLPSFLLVWILFPVAERLRSSKPVSAAIDGVSAAAVGLMAGATAILARGAIVDRFTALEALVCLGLLVRYRPNVAWLVLGGAIAGILGRFAGI